jgi:hypothetical protein
VTIDEDLLVQAVRELQEAGQEAHAFNVRTQLGTIADDGGYFDAMVVASDLAELESLAKLVRAHAVDWGMDVPLTRMAYILPV